MFGLNRFTEKFLSLKTAKVTESLNELLAKWDFTTATDADRALLAEELDKYSAKRAEAQSKFDEEQKEADVAKSDLLQKVQAAKLWESKLADSSTRPEIRKSIETEFPKLYSQIEKLKARAEKEIKEAEFAKKVFDSMDEVVQSINAKLKQKRSQSTQLQGELAIAQAEHEMAKQQIEAAKVLSGLKQINDSFDTASASMQKETKRLRNETQGMQHAAGLLTESNADGDSDFLKATLAEMSGKTSSTNVDLDALEAMCK